MEESPDTPRTIYTGSTCDCLRARAPASRRWTASRDSRARSSAHSEPHQAVGDGHADRAPHVIERPFAKRAARPRLRPRPHHARRPLPRRGLLARAAHAHERPVALRLRREEDRPARQRRVDLAEPRLHPLPQRLHLRAVRVNTRRYADEYSQEFRKFTSSPKLGFVPRS